jgi:uncharacterized protein
VSHRAIDAARSTDLEPYHLHLKEELLRPSQIAPVDIGLWPMGLRFRAGETLVLSIAATTIDPLSESSRWGLSIIDIPADGGTYMPGTKVPMMRVGGGGQAPAWVKAQAVKVPKSRNNGTHIIHFGGKYDSHVLMPIRMV